MINLVWRPAYIVYKPASAHCTLHYYSVGIGKEEALYQWLFK